MSFIERIRSRNPDQVRLRRQVFGLGLTWVIIVGISLFWTLWSDNRDVRTLAEKTARAHFLKDQAFRFWAASHGGVYVPVTERTYPNPNLDHIPYRDITKPDGTRLTLMNPAYMVRQIMDDYTGLYGVKGRITSLKFFHPANRPDEWETRALKAFEHGEDEVFEYTEVAGQPYLRLMRPMITQESCLPCHAIQGYKVGEVRGGVGVSLPLQPLYELRNQHRIVSFAGHGFLLMIGLSAAALFWGRESEHVDERTRMQTILEESEQKYRLMVDNQTDMIVKFDPDGRLLYVSPSYCDTFGKTEAEILGSKFMPMIHEEDREKVKNSIKAVLEEPYNAYVEERALTKEGWRHQAWWNTAVLNEAGEIENIVAVGRDITDRVNADAQLRESEEIYRAVVSNSTDSICIFNEKAEILLLNEAAARQLGHDTAEVIGKTIWKILPKAYSDARIETFQKIIGNGQRISFDSEIQLGEGVKSFQTTLIPIYFINQRVWLNISRDITEEKRAAELIEASLKEKETLLHEIHHRVKNNMQVISSLLNLQSNQLDDERTLKILQECRGRIYVLSAVHEILHGSENLSGIDLQIYFTKVVESIFTSFSVQPANIRLVTDIKPLLIRPDQAYPLGFVINELITNSLKYAFPDDRRGEISIVTKVEGSTLKILVADDGVGLPENLDWKNSNSLGLKLVRTLVENQLGGLLRMTNSSGTRFDISIMVDAISAL